MRESIISRIPTFFVDDGVSGVTYDRPGFQRCLQKLKRTRWLLYHERPVPSGQKFRADRACTPISPSRENGVRYIAINDDFDSAEPNSVNNDFAGIKNWFNEFYAAIPAAKSGPCKRPRANAACR
jgi:DNA invertase Pin-like site-specific DNA recombinase